MRRVDMMFEDTDSERNTVPKSEARLPGANEAPGTATSIRRAIEVAKVTIILNINKSPNNLMTNR